jgi:MFS family permease
MSAPTAAPSPALMRHRPFALFWGARVSSTAAYQMQAVAVGWQVYDLTGSAFDLGLVGLVQFVPLAMMVLVVGHVVDRYDRRTIVRVCQTVMCVAAAALAFLSARGAITKEAIFVLVFVTGTARAFENPAMHALMRGLVAPNLLQRAVAAASSANQTAIVAGPALGGLIYAFGPEAVYTTCATVYLAAAVLIALIRVQLPPLERKPITLESLFAGIAFIRRHQALLGAISLDLFAVLLGGATALLPIYARDILATGPWGLGLLRAAPAFGALAASIVLAHHPLRSRVGRTMFVAVTMFGAATIVFGLSTSFVLSMVALATLGASDAVSVVIRYSLLQTQTPNEMLGRVTAVNTMFTGTSSTLGEFESGLVASWFGAVASVLIGGVGTLVIVPIWMRAFPSLARIDSLDSRV